MKTYNDFLQKIEKIKTENDDLVNFKVTFTSNTLIVRGEYFEDGISQGYYNAGVVSYFYIATEKGYLSTDWKKTEFSKLRGVTFSKELFESLIPYIQNNSPKEFFRKSEGWGAAGVIANHSNSKIDYAANKMRQ